MWAFSEYDGLQLDAGSDDSVPTVRKPEGSVKGFEAQSATFRVGNRAFSARAMARDVGADPNSGRATFSIATADPSDSVLVGVASAEMPLDTPLSWEEDHAYFVECSSRGATVWSERAAAFGLPLTAPGTSCFGTDGKASVSVTWDAANVIFAALGGQPVTLPRPAAAEIQGRPAPCAEQPPLLPTVTLFTEATVVGVA